MQIEARNGPVPAEVKANPQPAPSVETRNDSVAANVPPDTFPAEDIALLGQLDADNLKIEHAVGKTRGGIAVPPDIPIPFTESPLADLGKVHEQKPAREVEVFPPPSQNPQPHRPQTSKMMSELTATADYERGLDDLARRVANGDVEAFQSLYERHLDTIYRYVYYKVGNGQLAEDLTQQIFMKAWEAINRYQWRELPFQHWLLRLARNTVIDHYRSTKPANASLLDQAGDFVDPEQELLQSEQIQTLQETVQQLPDEQREVIVLRFIEQMPHADIARRLGKSAATVRVIQHRALQALRRLLEQKKEPNVKGNSAGQRRLASILNSIRESTI